MKKPTPAGKIKNLGTQMVEKLFNPGKPKSETVTTFVFSKLRADKYTTLSAPGVTKRLFLPETLRLFMISMKDFVLGVSKVKSSTTMRAFS